MAFNNGFPMNYPQLYPPMPAMAGYSPQPPMQQQQQQQAGLTWVQGEAVRPTETPEVATPPDTSETTTP